jgi:hypothetical protein
MAANSAMATSASEDRFEDRVEDRFMVNFSLLDQKFRRWLDVTPGPKFEHISAQGAHTFPGSHSERAGAHATRGSPRGLAPFLSEMRRER